MCRLKLNYFNIRGRGEAIRMLLYRAKVDFDDYRLSVSEWFDHYKQDDTTSRQLPYVTINGKNYDQSVALMSYFATKHNLYGQKHLHRLICDQFVQYQEQLMVYDVEIFLAPGTPKKIILHRDFWDFLYSKPSPVNEKAMEKVRMTIYPRYMEQFEKLILENREHGSDVCVGKEVSLADIITHVGTQTALQVAPELVHKYPAVMSIRQVVEEADGLKEYLRTRPFCSL